MLIKPLSCQMVSQECKILNVYFASVYIFMVFSFDSVRACVKAKSSALCEDSPFGSTFVSVTFDWLITVYSALFSLSEFITLPSMTQVSKAKERGVLLI